MLRFVSLTALLATGCYQEGLGIYDLHGTVVLPEEAGNRTTEGGNVIEDDPRLFGPVYLGLYPAVESGTREFPYPEVGPSFQSGVPGDTYPYGGTTIGDLRYACLEDLVCKMTSGRFVDFDEIVTWFNDDIDQPIYDAFGNQIQTGEYIRQTCFDLLAYTSDEEIRITVTDDRNDDGHLDADDLDFVQRSDGKWEAEFTVWQQEWFEGFALWGWMDAPSDTTFRFSTCDASDGYSLNEYSEEYMGGRQFRELLNYPSSYLGAGDFVPSADPTTDAYVWDDPLETMVIELDFPVEF